MANYGPDLAYIHNSGFSGFALDSAPGLLALLRRNGVDRGHVVDLGCGSGVWARQLGFSGYDVSGIDGSEAMLQLATKNAPKAKFSLGSFADAKLPRCNAITCLGECVSYAFSTGLDEARFFRRVYRALRPGGVFIFDYARAGRDPAGMPTKSFWTGTDWAVLVEQEQNTQTAIVTRRLTTFRKLGSYYRRSEETHNLKLFRKDQLRAKLEQAGFSAHELRGYGGYLFRSGHAGILARKPG